MKMKYDRIISISDYNRLINGKTIKNSLFSYLQRTRRFGVADISNIVQKVVVCKCIQIVNNERFVYKYQSEES